MAKKAKNTQTNMESMAAESADMMKDLFGQANVFSKNLSELSRSNMEAMTQSLEATGKGFNEIGTKMMGFMQANIQRNLETARTLSSAKSFEDLSALQDVTKEGLKAYAGQMNELGNLFAATLKEASEPINAQAGAIVETFQASA